MGDNVTAEELLTKFGVHTLSGVTQFAHLDNLYVVHVFCRNNKPSVFSLHTVFGGGPLGTVNLLLRSQTGIRYLFWLCIKGGSWLGSVFWLTDCFLRCTRKRRCALQLALYILYSAIAEWSLLKLVEKLGAFTISPTS